MNVPVTSIRLGGGGARSPLWRQIQADVYGHAVEIVEAEEGAAYGAALLAGVGAGVWPSVDAACTATVRIAARVTPQAVAVAALNASYAAYRRIYPRHPRDFLFALSSWRGWLMLRLTRCRGPLFSIFCYGGCPPVLVNRVPRLCFPACVYVLC